MNKLRKATLKRSILKFIYFYLVYIGFLSVFACIINYLFIPIDCIPILFNILADYACFYLGISFILLPLLLLYHYALALYPPKLLTRIIVGSLLSICISLPVSSLQFGIELNPHNLIRNLVIFALTGGGAEAVLWIAGLISSIFLS